MPDIYQRQMGVRKVGLSFANDFAQFRELLTVPVTGLEPARPKTQDPKSCVSTNSTTPALHPSLNAQVLSQFGHMSGCPYVVLREFDLAVLVDHERRADHALDDLAVQLLFAECAIRV